MRLNNTRTGLVATSLAAACGLAVWPSAAHASVTLSNAIWLVSAEVDVDTPSAGAHPGYQLYVTTPATLSGQASALPGAPAGGSGQVVASAAPLPSPLLTAYSTATATYNPQSALHDYNQSSASTTLQYQLMVNGPTAQVPVNVVWSLDVSGTPAAPGDYSNSAAGASFALSLNFNNLVSDSLAFYSGSSDALGTAATGHLGAHSGNTVVTLATGVAYTVNLAANAIVSIRGDADPIAQLGGGTETNDASADPTFAIASGVPNAAAYSFSFSPGIGNAPAAVPEPASTTLFLGGIAGLAFHRLRRRRWRPAGAGGRRQAAKALQDFAAWLSRSSSRASAMDAACGAS